VFVGDDKFSRETLVGFGVYFQYFLHVRKARTLVEQRAELGKLLWRSAGKRFDATIRQIAHEAAQMQLLRGILREIAKPHPLHAAGHKVPLGLSYIAHRTRNCSREVYAIAVSRHVAVRHKQRSKLDFAKAPLAMLWHFFGIETIMSVRKPSSKGRGAPAMCRWALALGILMLAGLSALAQQPPEGPMDPPPEHHATRIGNVPDPGEPPNLPIDEVIKKLSQKEDTYFLARTGYTYRKTIRIQELGQDGRPTGEYTLVTQAGHDPDGTLVDKVVERPKSTLEHMQLESEDLETLNRIPAFPLTTSQLGKYNLKYIGKDQIDEISCYIFEVKPKVVERVHAYFQGVVWIDDKYLEVVKTYGSWVNDLGDVKSSPQVPFTMFETYREFVDDKYWFPTYSRSDETLHLKGQDVPLRMVIKWTDFKPLAGGTQTNPPPNAGLTPAPTPADPITTVTPH
jgi:hypothetical protein